MLTIEHMASVWLNLLLIKLIAKFIGLSIGEEVP